MIRNTLINGAILGLLIGAFYTGAYLERLDAENAVAKAEGMCKDRAKLMAYLAKGMDGYVCFREHEHTKKISKSLLVIQETDKE